MAPAPPRNGSAIEAPRFEGVVRPYSEEDVKRLQGSLKIEHTLALEGSKKLWVRPSIILRPRTLMHGALLPCGGLSVSLHACETAVCQTPCMRDAFPTSPH